MSKPTTKAYTVVTNVGGDYTIAAAYYTHEDDFTLFKESDGSIVASFANRELVAIMAANNE